MAIVLAIVGAAVAVALGFGIAALTLDTTTTVEVPVSEVVPEAPGAGVGGGNNDAYINPDRELRELMIRRCSEQIGC
jgi:hypothetical protein